MKTQPKERKEYICKASIWEQIYFQNILKLTKLSNEARNKILKCAMDINRFLSKKETQMAHKHMKTLSIISHFLRWLTASLGKCKLPGPHFTRDGSRKNDNKALWQGPGEAGSLLHCQWAEKKRYSHFKKSLIVLQEVKRVTTRPSNSSPNHTRKGKHMLNIPTATWPYNHGTVPWWKRWSIWYKKEWSTGTCYDMDEPWKQDAEAQRATCHTIPCTWTSKRGKSTEPQCNCPGAHGLDRGDAEECLLMHPRFLFLLQSQIYV